MNFGEHKLDLESFAASSLIVVILSACVWCIIASMLNKDYRILSTLR